MEAKKIRLNGRLYYEEKIGENVYLLFDSIHIDNVAIRNDKKVCNEFGYEPDIKKWAQKYNITDVATVKHLY